LDEVGVPDPMYIISNQAHGTNADAKVKRFLKAVGHGFDVPSVFYHLDFHVLFNPDGKCVLLEAEYYESPLASKPPKRHKVLTQNEIQTKVLTILQSR